MLSCQYLPEVFGGAEQQCQRLSRTLALAGHDVTVLTSRIDRNLPATERMDRVEVVRLRVGAPPQLGGRHILSMFLWIAKVLLWIGRRRGDYDVLHMHQAKANAFAGVLAGRLFDLPTVIKVGNSGRGFDLQALRRKRYIYGRLMAEFVRRNVDLAVALSSQIAGELEEFGVNRGKIIRIPNGIDDRQTKPSADRGRSSAPDWPQA